MVEFSKILKKIKGIDTGAPREERGPRKARREPAPPPVPRSRSAPPPRPAPVPVREEPPVPAMEEVEAPEEKVSLKPVKPLFARHRAQASLEAAAETSVPVQATPEATQQDVSPPQPPAQAEAPRVLEKAEPSISMPEALALYDRMMDVARRLLDQEATSERIDGRESSALMGEVVNVISTGDERLIELAVTYLLKDEESYLPQHSVNVTILSLAIGQRVGYDPGRMMELGLTAFLHDIGMTAYKDMTDVKRPLTDREFDKIKEHVEVGQKMLQEIHPGLSDAVLSAQYEIHERMDASGYPTGRRTIHECARIIALADTFESMIHPRPFRSRYPIMEVYKRIFAAKQKYDPAFIKVLVDRLGFFPNGAFIQLNTKEVGRVVAQNRRSPLRPVIRLLFDEGGRRLYDDDSKDVNLMKYPTLHVVKCFLEEAALRAGADGP